MNHDKANTCVVCGEKATGTAAQIPVCTPHREEYDEEGRKYLPLVHREFYQKLIAGYEAVYGRPYFI